MDPSTRGAIALFGSTAESLAPPSPATYWENAGRN